MGALLSDAAVSHQLRQLPGDRAALQLGAELVAGAGDRRGAQQEEKCCDGDLCSPPGALSPCPVPAGWWTRLVAVACAHHTLSRRQAASGERVVQGVWEAVRCHVVRRSRLPEPCLGARTGCNVAELHVCPMRCFSWRALLPLVLLARLAHSETPVTRYAICLTGQLKRLELFSKVANIFAPNLRAGAVLGVFAYLDNSTEMRATSGQGKAPDFYDGMSAAALQHLLHETTTEAAVFGAEQLHVEVQLSDEHQWFTVYNNNTGGLKQHFQLNFAMMSQWRACALMVERHELKTRQFYDYVMRLRDDTYALDAWHLDAVSFRGSISAVEPGGWGGLNDHNFVFARDFMQAFFRAPTEDYYMAHLHWMAGHNSEEVGNPEGLLKRMADQHGAVVKPLHPCLLHATVLRGLADATQWLLHPTYSRLYDEFIVAHNASNTCSTDVLRAKEAALGPIERALIDGERIIKSVKR